MASKTYALSTQAFGNLASMAVTKSLTRSRKPFRIKNVIANKDNVINHLADALIPDHLDHQINVPALVRYRTIFFSLEP